ncbi:MAG: nuclear transport factor 2 family protein [Burkholderiaceae bacterium]
MIYRSVVRARLRRAFRALNEGNNTLILAAFAPDAKHTFFGEHALGGARQSPGSICAWYSRLAVLFPDLCFDLESILVEGMPWNTTAVVTWRDHFTLRDGACAGNQGVHVIQLRWGRVRSLQIHCDTQKLAGVLSCLERQGVREAGLAPITDEDLAGPRQGISPRPLAS